MDELDRLLAESTTRRVRLVATSNQPARVGIDSVLFDAIQLPLVALATLAYLVADRRRSVAIAEIGLRVGSVLMEAFPQFNAVGRRLQWSLRVRATTADALLFLEGRAFVTVSERRATRHVAVVSDGRAFVKALSRADSDTRLLAETIQRAAVRAAREDLSLL